MTDYHRLAESEASRRRETGLSGAPQTRFTVGLLLFLHELLGFSTLLSRKRRFRRPGTGVEEALRTAVSCLSAPFWVPFLFLLTETGLKPGGRPLLPLSLFGHQL